MHKTAEQIAVGVLEKIALSEAFIERAARGALQRAAGKKRLDVSDIMEHLPSVIDSAPRAHKIMGNYELLMHGLPSTLSGGVRRAIRENPNLSSSLRNINVTLG